MLTASDGSVFTGAVTVYVTGDAGIQALGSVGSGVCQDEGNGYYTYAPAQAETNYDIIAFTFVGTLAANTTVQVLTNFPQTVDNDTKLTTIDGKVDTAQLDLDTITGATGVNLLAATQASIDAIEVDTSTTLENRLIAIEADTDLIDDGTSGLVKIAADVALILADTGTAGVVISAATANAIADALLTRDWTSVTGEAARSVLNALRLLRNKYSIAGTTLTVTEEDDTTAAWTSTLTTDATADPVTASDPV